MPRDCKTAHSRIPSADIKEKQCSQHRKATKSRKLAEHDEKVFQGTVYEEQISDLYGRMQGFHRAKQGITYNVVRAHRLEKGETVDSKRPTKPRSSPEGGET